jgi:hypothetical protein
LRRFDGVVVDPMNAVASANAVDGAMSTLARAQASVRRVLGIIQDS